VTISLIERELHSDFLGCLKISEIENLHFGTMNAVCASATILLPCILTSMYVLLLNISSVIQLIML
jgi:hypothetical protein